MVPANVRSGAASICAAICAKSRQAVGNRRIMRVTPAFIWATVIFGDTREISFGDCRRCRRRSRHAPVSAGSRHHSGWGRGAAAGNRAAGPVGGAVGGVVGGVEGGIVGGVKEYSEFRSALVRPAAAIAGTELSFPQIKRSIPRRALPVSKLTCASRQSRKVLARRRKRRERHRQEECRSPDRPAN